MEEWEEQQPGCLLHIRGWVNSFKDVEKRDRDHELAPRVVNMYLVRLQFQKKMVPIVEPSRFNEHNQLRRSISAREGAQVGKRLPVGGLWRPVSQGHPCDRPATGLW